MGRRVGRAGGGTRRLAGSHQVLTHPEIPLRKKSLLQRTFQGKIDGEILAVLLMLIRRGHEPDIDTVHDSISSCGMPRAASSRSR